ncbi:MAG: sigma-70 family RNA polymerase sigma factor [Myxococcales bacterium]|nr:sigma-70 family RNA polymerase sigma factor [Myxococcales bacterium]
MLSLVRAVDDDATDDVAPLVVRAQRGETEARRLLFVRFAPELAALLRRILGRTCDVEDAVQQGFLIALEQLPRLHEPGAFRPWLYQLAIRAARRTFWTQRLRELAWPGDNEPLWQAEDLGAGLSPADQARLVLLGQRLSRLPLPLRQAWIVRYQFDCTLPETAQACGCSLATVKRRLDEAEAHLERSSP